MEDELLGIIIDRLDGSELSERATDVLLAAYEGDAPLDAVMGGAPARPRAEIDRAEDTPEPAGAYLRSITVQGFRGIGEPATLPLQVGPGLTIVTGRNGSGKSSFAEALELLLTGRLRRWDGLTAVWKEGWHNLHTTLPTEITAELDVEDAGPTQVRRAWADGGGIDEGTAFVQVAGEKRTDLERLGWRDDLTAYRPFLSHAELEVFFSGRPSDLYEMLASVLGLDDLTETSTRLSTARRARENALKSAKTGLQPLLGELVDIDDERADVCHVALGGRTWNLDEADSIVTGTAPADPAGSLAQLRRVAQLSAPALEEVSSTADRLTTAADELEAVARTDAGRAAALAGLLRRALAHHHQHGDGQCPVCHRGGALDDAWRAATEKEADRLEQEAKEATAARQNADAAWAAVRSLVCAPPEALPADGNVAGLDVARTRTAWETWAALPGGDGPEGLRRVATHLTTTWDPLASSLTDATAAASAEVTAREDRWGPLAARLATWCTGARRAQAGAVDVGNLKAAEKWLKDATDDIRNDRLQPLTEKTKAIWAQLRQESNVELGAIRLTGSATRRQLDIDVEVDGSASAGLSVMSQGEVNALGLSVFLPRATMSVSPFRFLVIDDPVQAMDPAKVDGLARVFGETAKDRQIVVFTHDDRLPEAIRRLEIPATVLEVTRRPGSKLALRRAMDPVERALRDADAICAGDKLPAEVAARVVGPLCRTALEAAFTEIARSRLLRMGRRRHDVEDALCAARTLYQSAALALFGDMDRGDEVLGYLGRLSSQNPTTFKTLNRSAHVPVNSNLRALVADTRRLVDQIRAQAR